MSMQARLYPGAQGTRRACRHGLGQSMIAFGTATLMYLCSRGPASHGVHLFDWLAALT